MRGLTPSCAAQNKGTLKTELRKYTNPSLLILDEIGYLPIDQRGADLLFQVISARYERGSIILTTNMNGVRVHGFTFVLP